MIVGDRTPQSAPVEAEGDRSAGPASGEVLRRNSRPGPGGAGLARSAGAPAGWVLAAALALLAAGMIARQHLRGVGRRSRSASRNGVLEETAADPPLRFIDSGDEASGRSP
jgi:hypothetical protein